MTRLILRNEALIADEAGFSPKGESQLEHFRQIGASQGHQSTQSGMGFPERTFSIGDAHFDDRMGGVTCDE